MSTSGATEILPDLWIGGIKAAQNKEWIEQNIDIVLNCTKDIDFISEHKTNIRFPVEDNLEDEEILRMHTYLENATRIIDTQIRQGKRILVHCLAGKQRSASVVCAYIMIYLELPFEKASLFLRSKRNIIFEPQCNFQPALLQLQHDLEEKRKTVDRRT